MSPWRGMAIDAGASGEDEIREMAAMIEQKERERHEKYLWQKHLDESHADGSECTCFVSRAELRRRVHIDEEG